ncbi:MAG: DNA-3-methyladenine glycosylase family protein [Chloroflexota bacterium]
MPRLTLHLDRPLDLERTLSPHRRGLHDPQMRLAGEHVIRSTRTPDGPATVELRRVGDSLGVEAWGPGADRALAAVPAFVGIDDDRTGFAPANPLLADLDRRRPGLRIGRSGAVLEALIPAILEQKVTGTEARRAYRGIIARWGEPAPGPFELRLMPPPELLATIAYHEFHPLGLERRRADLIRAVAARAGRFEEIVAMPLGAAYGRLRAMPGIGPWTAAEVALRALGDADAVSVGDYHLPSLVAYALAGERKATDERMLDLLEPFRGHRGRVIRLLEDSGIRPEARGPRMQPRSIAAI